MRALLQWAMALAAALLGWSAEAEIRVLKANGQPVPAGSASVTFDSATGGWTVALFDLYAMWSNTVYEIHGDGGEIIDNLLIYIDGPPAGSPLIVRVLSDPPNGLQSVHNIIQYGTAETLLNRVVVAQDIGTVQVEAIGDLIAGRDIVGPIIATTLDNAARGITSAQAGRDIIGDLVAENGRILLVWAQRDIGAPPVPPVSATSKPINILAKHNVLHVVGGEVHAHINARANGGSGGMYALQANRFFGSLETEQLLTNNYTSAQGMIMIAQQLAGNVTIGKSYTNAAQLIQTPMGGLTAQIIINADSVPGGAWTAPVRIGAAGEPQQIILPNAAGGAPAYPHTPAQLGGGSIGLVPFRLHLQACSPPNVGGGANANITPSSAPLAVDLRHYGPVMWNNTPIIIDRRPAGTQAPFVAAPMTDFAIAHPVHDRNVVRITAAPDKPGFVAGFEYRIRATESLKCDVAAQPPVLWTADYLVTVTTPPCPGDINASGNVDVSDLLIMLAFWGPASPLMPAADVTSDGIVNVDDLLVLLGHWGPC